MLKNAPIPAIIQVECLVSAFFYEVQTSQNYSLWDKYYTNCPINHVQKIKVTIVFFLLYVYTMHHFCSPDNSHSFKVLTHRIWILIWITFNLKTNDTKCGHNTQFAIQSPVICYDEVRWVAGLANKPQIDTKLGQGLLGKLCPILNICVNWLS